MSERSAWLEMDFLPGGDAGARLGEGWSFQEDGGIWAVGPASAITLPPAPSAERGRLEFLCWPMLMPPHLPRQRLEILLNDRPLYSGELTSLEPVRIGCDIPPGTLRSDGENRLALLHPDAAAPAAFSPDRGDRRPLAILAMALRIDAPVETPAELQPAAVQADAQGPTGRGLVLCSFSPVAFEIGRILDSFPPFEDAFELRFVQNDVDSGNILQTLAEADRRRVVAVWEEVADRPAEPYTNSRHPIPRSIARVRFPRLTMRCLWPLAGPDPRSVPEPPFYPKGRYTHTDGAALQLLDEAKLADAALYDRYIAVSHAMLRDPESGLAEDAARWRALDARCDVKVTGFILENFRSVALFYAPEVPAGALLAYVTEHLLASLLPGLAMRPSELYRQFAFYIHGYAGSFFDQAPIHPALVETFGLSYLPAEPRYRRGYGARTFREHILDYIRWAPWFS
ncbi:MAG: hypothetical protein JO264_08670 [Acidisphaera sp.]|nr:hypothetical protein [Acidisphaera sp.]